MMRLLKIENSAVFAPMPSASVAMVTKARTRTLAQPANGVTDILSHVVEHTHRPHLACVLDGERDVAYRPPTCLRRIVCSEAVTLQCILPERAMGLDLLAQVGVVARPTEEVQQPSEERLHGINPSGRPQHALNRANHAVELGAFGGKLFAARGGECVVAGAAIVLRRTPFGLHPAVEEQPLERGIQRTLADAQHVVGRQTQVLDDAIAMLRSADERLQDQELERARQKIGRSIG